MKKLIVTVVIAAAALSLAVLPASAANRPNPLFDQVATEVAGHPVSVWCEDSREGWTALSQAHGLGGWPGPQGFTGLSEPIVYLAPWVCNELWFLAALPPGTDPSKVPGTAAGRADQVAEVRILLHESVHQRGGDYSSVLPGDGGQNFFEGRTDCAANALLPSYLPRFGVPAEFTVSVPVSVSTKHKKAIRNRKGKIVRWKRWVTYKLVYHDETRPNPFFAEVLAEAKKAHNETVGAVPWYKGGCE